MQSNNFTFAKQNFARLFQINVSQGHKVANFKLNRGFATVWALIAVVAVVFSLVAVFAIKHLNSSNPPAGQTQQVQDEDSQVRALESLSSSDEPDAIEQDINATKLEDLDQELKGIDQDLTGIQ